jgi:hypothetical protein
MMGTTQDHRRYAEQCVVMAQRSEDDNDKALWLTLAQSWVRLAEHVAHVETDVDSESEEAQDDLQDALDV